MPAIEMTNPAALPADWRDLLALTKPRVMSLVVFSGLCGMLAAPILPPLALGFTAILCIALGAGGGGALNQYYEGEIDAKKRRAAKRAPPGGGGGGGTAPPFGGGADGAAARPPFRSRPERLLGAADGPCDQLACSGAACRIDPVLRLHLHDLAEAPDPAEHRHRRRGRSVPAADRLGRIDGTHR